MPSNSAKALSPDQMRRRFDPELVPFESTEEAAQCGEPVLGQERAKQALDFGLSMHDMTYHVFVAGPDRTGKTHLVRTFVEKIAQEQPVPDDWVYVHCFQQPDQPMALRLDPGQGKELAKDMAALVDTLKEKIPEAFEGEDYARRRESVVNDFKRRRSDIFQELDKQAKEQGYALRFEPTGIVVAPADEDGQPLADQAIREMSDEDREALREKSDLIQGKVSESLRQVAAMEKELQTAINALDKEVVLGSVGHHIDDLIAKFKSRKRAVCYLEEVRKDITEHFERFKKKEAPQGMPFAMPQQEDTYQEYKVNVFVDNSEAKGAPVVVETNPTFPNLFGRIERQAQFGALVTDFTLLKSGALHQANGGYLVLPVLELLRYGLPYEGLKRALMEGKVIPEDVMEQMGYMVTRTLKPAPIELDIKVILVGDTSLYHLLYMHDNKFQKLFKIRAQLDDRMDWGEDEIAGFVAHLCSHCKANDLMPLHRSAVARLLELGAELAADQKSITLRIADVEDVIKESHFLASRNQHQYILADDVDKAIEARRYRASLIDERMQESITRGYIDVATDGTAMGQVNGLAVFSMGDASFGKPSRISASVGLGKPGIVAIDREADLSGPIHNKGVLILGGFLRHMFAQKGPITMNASLVFEQSYGMVDGDSATLAEALTLISQLSGLPLRQDLAITGSMNQTGKAQAIGGVNHKVEGFFRLCKERGLTGDQGVVVPMSNVQNLMLHKDIVAAAEEGKFHIYSVENIEQAVELFTGVKAGVRNKKGNFPRGTVFYKVEKELERVRKLLKEQDKSEDKKD